MQSIGPHSQTSSGRAWGKGPLGPLYQGAVSVCMASLALGGASEAECISASMAVLVLSLPTKCVGGAWMLHNHAVRQGPISCCLHHPFPPSLSNEMTRMYQQLYISMLQWCFPTEACAGLQQVGRAQSAPYSPGMLSQLGFQCLILLILQACGA